MPLWLRYFLRYVVFRGHYWLYVLIVIIPLCLYRWGTTRAYADLLGFDQNPKDIPAQLNSLSANTQYTCSKGSGDWEFICDRYITVPNGPLAKGLVGIDVNGSSYVIVDFPTGRPYSRQAMRAWRKEQERFLTLVDLNSGDEAGIGRLPGIDRTLARRIVTASRERPFRSVDDLQRVEGINRDALERIRPRARAGLNGRVHPEDFLARFPES